jgi:hypothetical protein
MCYHVSSRVASWQHVWTLERGHRFDRLIVQRIRISRELARLWILLWIRGLGLLGLGLGIRRGRGGAGAVQDLRHILRRSLEVDAARLPRGVALGAAKRRAPRRYRRQKAAVAPLNAHQVT